MFLNRAVGVGSLAVVSLALLLLPAESVSAQRGIDNGVSVPRPDVDSLIPRTPSRKTLTAELQMPPDATGTIVVKFNDNVRARVQAGVLNAANNLNVEPARLIMNQFGLKAKPLFTWSPQRLANLENKAAAYSNKAQPDLAGMIAFDGPDDNLVAAARAFNDLPSVEWVTFRQKWALMPMGGARRCCDPGTGACTFVDPITCVTGGGIPGLAGSLCTDGACGPGGCCIDADNSCENAFDEEDCVVNRLGTYQGFGTDCNDPIDCGPSPTERRCCNPVTGECTVVEPEICAASGGTPGNAGTTCVNFECGPGGCCILTSQDCENAFNSEDCVVTRGGVYQGFATDCIEDDIDCSDVQCGAALDTCFDIHVGQACNDEDCCQLVCGLLPFCCELNWEEDCADIANLFCTTPLPPNCPNCPDRCASGINGDCFTPHSTGGCIDATCCNLVCSLDPFCCDTVAPGGFWDDACVTLAEEFCGGVVTTGPTPLFTAQQGYLRPASYVSQAGGVQPNTIAPTRGEGWNLGGDNYGMWVINEINIVPDPTDGDANLDMAVNDGDQFIEIVNNFGVDLLIGGWTLTSAEIFGPGCGNCYLPNGDGLTGCDDDLVCEGLVCAADPFCCVGWWDINCANLAADLCSCAGGGIETTRHEFPVGTVVRAGEAIVVFGTVPPDPADATFGGSIVQGATVGGSPTNTMGFYPPTNIDQSGTVRLKNAEGVVVTNYTWGREGSNRSAITRRGPWNFPPLDEDVTGPDVLLNSPGLGPLFPCDVPGDCPGSICFGDTFPANGDPTGACPGTFSPGTRSDGTTFSFDRYKGIYGASRELFESFGFGETIPPGSSDYDDLRFNARGKGIRVGVIEWSFYTGHEDLSVIIEDGQTIVPTLENSPGHATACLGIINAKENGFGITGIAPEAQVYFFPLFSAEEGDRDEAAFLSAYNTLGPGDIVSCSFGPGNNLNNNLIDWTLIRMGSDLGITTCIAAGNDCINLSSLNSLGDSGAVVVGAGEPGAPWCRLIFSNYFQDGDLNEDSNVIHVQAWGTAVTTTGGHAELFNPDDDPNRSYTNVFGGTSAACPQIAGLAACLQGLSKQVYGIHLGPAALRGALASGRAQCLILDPDDLPGFPNPPCGPDTDPDSGPNKIGVYPVPGRDEGSGSWSVLNNSGFDASPLINDLVIITGRLIQGNVFSIKGPDDNYLVIESRHANANGVGGANGGIATGQTTMFQLVAYMPNPTIESLLLEVEAFVDNGTGIQLIYMFDWQLNRWLAVAVQFLGVTDTDIAVEFEIENASRFIRNSDNRLMLRLQTVALGVGGLHRSSTDWVNISRNVGDAFISAGP